MADLGSSRIFGNLDMRGFDIKNIGNINAVTATELGYLSGVTSSIQTQLNAKVPNTLTVNGHTLSGNVAVTLSDLGISATAAEINVLDGITATVAELNYIDGVTSSIQTQLNAKVANTTTVNGHALSANISVTLTDLGITATAAEINTLDGITATVTELNYVDGVTSNIQTQLNAKMATASIICGSSTFNSTTGVTITHNIGNTTYRVLITPTSNPSGYLGEIYVTKSTNTVVVYISGSTTTATFDYMIIKY